MTLPPSHHNLAAPWPLRYNTRKDMNFSGQGAPAAMPGEPGDAESDRH